ncbi:hypothetical protein GCM10011369_08580 [Neiella marina]|uniref:Thioesterase family protein n=1 Tax=Neiella marina TaxID=508461 RepID=A0A8J2XN04_9GAMM|nr:thioesterase family protein [Neiella marina]GGA69217.1 hypothetical protein GCM10011369_08580 [Neiella marina]
MHIDQLLSQIDSQNDNQAIQLSVTNDWAQGRTLFGGLSASLAYRAIENKLTAPRMLRSFNTSFIGPIYPDKDFTVEAEILREGRNATQAVARIIQDGNTAVMCQAAFGVGRASKIAVQDRRKHHMVAPSKANFIPQIPKVTPKFLRNIDLAKCDGGWPFTGRKSHHVGGWMRFKTPPAQLTNAHLIALIDAWPPTVLQMLRWPAPASTMSWNVEFIHPHRPMSPENWFAYQAHTRQAADGYGHTEADIYDSYGELVAISRQVVAVFD